MPNQILLSVDKKRLSVAPGASVELAVSVQNLTTLVDQVAVRLEGIDPAWVQVIPQYLPVFAQGQATARVMIQPPRDPAQALAGVYPLRVRGTSQEYPGLEGEAAADLEVQLVGDYRFWLEKAETSGEQEALFPLKVQNSANAPLRLQFKGSDGAEALWYKFDPFQLLVSPGGAASATATIRVKHAAAAERTVVFSLTAQGEFGLGDGAAVAAAILKISGQFVQSAPTQLAILIQPPQAEAADRADYQVRIRNPGLAPVTVQLSGADRDNSLDFVLQPAQVVLPPQGEVSAILSVRVKTGLTPGARQTRVLSVTALPVNDGPPSVSAEANFVQVGTVPAPVAKPFPWWMLVSALIALCLISVLIVAVIVQMNLLSLFH
jgi:hypothetical protein